MSGKKLRDKYDMVFGQMNRDAKKEVKQSLRLPAIDDDLQGWARKNGFRKPSAGEYFPQYRRALQNEIEKRVSQ